MIVKLKYIGVITDNLPEKLELEEDSSIDMLIEELKSDYDPQRIEDLVMKSTFLVNKSKAGKETILKDGDELLVLSVLGGG